MPYECQIFVCATHKELPWLNACLRSVQRYWSSPISPIVILTPDCKHSIPDVVTELSCNVVFKASDLHNCVRMTADSYLCAPLVMFLDVNHLFTQKCDISSFQDCMGRPIIFMERYSPAIRRPYAEVNSIINWRMVIDDLLGSPPEFEYTSHAPMVFYRNSIRRMRESMECRNKRPMDLIIKSQYEPYFSCMNFMASHCHANEAASYEWLPSTTERPEFLYAFWGIRDPRKGDDLVQINKILMGSNGEHKDTKLFHS